MFDAICFLFIRIYIPTYICMYCVCVCVHGVFIHHCLYVKTCAVVVILPNQFNSKSHSVVRMDGEAEKKTNAFEIDRWYSSNQFHSSIHTVAHTHPSIHPSYNNSNKVETSSRNNSHLIFAEVRQKYIWHECMWFIMCHLNVRICKKKSMLQ